MQPVFVNFKLAPVTVCGLDFLYRPFNLAGMKKLIVGLFGAVIMVCTAVGQIQASLEAPKARLNEINLRICVSGEELAGAEYMRAIVKTAVDEAGHDLINPRLRNGGFNRVSDSDKINVKLQNLGGKVIREFSGEVEVFISKNDPDSVVSIDNIEQEIGKPIASPILSAAGITLIIYNRELIDSIKSKTVDDPAALKDFSKGNVGRENTIALRIQDPNMRFVGAGFRDANDTGVGRHAALKNVASANKMTMYDLYTKPVRMLFFLSTPKSLIKVPFCYHDVTVTQDY